jgi:hypothetical protein
MRGPGLFGLTRAGTWTNRAPEGGKNSIRSIACEKRPAAIIRIIGIVESEFFPLQ